MNTNNAEVKPAKFGETSASNVGGNPEPSPSSREGVETRRRVCKICNNEVFGRKDKIYCSTKCRQRAATERYDKKHSRRQMFGVGSGGNQWGADNHRYKNGIKGFSQRALAHYGKKCRRCGSHDNILVHHKDHNRDHNELANLEVLCKRCHQEHHCNRDPKTGKYTKG